MVKPNNLYVDVHPASWYAVAASRDLAAGDRKPVDAFGERLVLWRSDAGVAHVQQRFCPHMGASLACGDVVGERIVCPFHRWEYDGGGACQRIPYMQRSDIPKRARLATYPVVEQNGHIWAFNGKEPTHALPELPEYGDKGFVIRTRTQVFENHPLLILENGCDAQHFKYIHRVEFERYEVEMRRNEAHAFGFDVHQYEVKQAVGRFKLGAGTIVTSINYVGASLIHGRVHQNGNQLFAFIAAPTPIGPNRTQFRLIVAVKKLPWYLAMFNRLYATFVARHVFDGATDDYVPVWKEMDGNFRGVLVEEDRLQQQFRRYYHGHLPPVLDVTANAS